MPANITAKIQLTDSATSLPDGTYQGLWSGYAILMTQPNGTEVCVLETVDGCRSLDGAPVVITVANGIATVEM